MSRSGGEHGGVRTRRRAVQAVAVVSVLTAVQLVTARPADAQSLDPRDWIGAIGDAIGGALGGTASKLADAAATAVFDRVLEFVAGLIADAVTTTTELLTSVFDRVDVQLDASGTLSGALSSRLHLQMLALGAVLVTILWLARVVSGLVHQQMGAVLRELFFDLPFTIVGTAAAGALGAIVLAVTNEMSASFSSSFAEGLGSFAGEMFSSSALLTGGLFSMVFALLYIVGSIVIAAELVIRAALLTIVFAVAPVMMATRAWDGSRRYARRFVEIAIALMFAKPATAFALSLGVSQLADATADTSPVKLMIGSTVVLLGAFMPFAVFKLLPVVEAAGVQQGVKGAPVRVMQSVSQMAIARSMFSSGGGAATAGASGEGAGGGSGGWLGAAGAAAPASSAGSTAQPSSSTHSPASAHSPAPSTSASPSSNAAGSGGVAATGGAVTTTAGPSSSQQPGINTTTGPTSASAAQAASGSSRAPRAARPRPPAREGLPLSSTSPSFAASQEDFGASSIASPLDDDVEVRVDPDGGS